MPAVTWAQTDGRAMAESEQKSAVGLLSHSDQAGTQAGPKVAVAPWRKTAKPGPTNLPATKPGQRAESSLAHSPSAVKHNTGINSAAAAGLTKARELGVGGPAHRNATAASSSVQYGVPISTRRGPGALMAHEPLALTAPRLASSSVGGGTASAPANVIARHSAVSAAVGGTPSYEPPRNATLAVIGGTMMKRNKL